MSNLTKPNVARRPPLKFKKCSSRPVEFEKCPCHMSLSFSISDRMSLRPKMPHVALSILGVYGHYGRETNGVGLIP